MFDSQNLHHAYCIQGEREAVFSKLCIFFEEELKIATRGNPDFWHGQFETLSIEEGRNLKERQQNRSWSGGKKIFVVSTDSITREAQNSLLKIFEEPTEGTHFFLILPSAEILLPTLRSRLQIISHGDPREGEKVTKDQEIEEFVKAGKAERLAFLKEIIEEKDKQKAVEFLDRVENYLRKKADFSKIKKEEVDKLQEIIKVKKYLRDQGASMKMILEHIALFL